MGQKMNQKKKKKVFGTIIAFIVFAAIMAGITYAWLSWRSNNTVINGTTGCFTIDYAAGSAITGTLKLKDLALTSVAVGSSFTYDSATMAKTTVTMGLNASCHIQGTGTITLNTTTITAALINSGDSKDALNYVVVNNSNTVLAKGAVTTGNGTSQNVLTGFNLTTPATAYTIILWIDGNKANVGAIGGNYTGYISASAVQNQA